LPPLSAVSGSRVRTMPGIKPPPSLRQRALLWLAQREHSRQELHDKLLRWVRAVQVASTLGGAAPACEMPEEEQIPALLDELEAAGHLSDARAVESRIHVRAPRFGNLRIQQELERLGVEAGPEARQALHSTEHARARSVWERKFGTPPRTAAERARQMRFMAGRGFTAETVRAVMRAPDDGTTEDDSPS